jgi:hypothetical protein
MRRLRDLLPEPLFTWLYVGGRDGMLCMAYGGTMPDGRVRVCGKRRGHFDSHAYEFLDAIHAAAKAKP